MPKQQYDNELRGVLFKNKDREGSQPHYRGNCQIDGEEYPISAWIRESERGVSYMSLSFTRPPEDNGRGNGKGRRDDDRPARRDRDDDDGLPF